MKICFFGIYDPTYSRNDVLITGLRELGVEVIECREDWRDPKRYLKLWRRLRALKNGFDCVYAAYPSPVPTLLARLITRKPVVADAFYSMYDSVVNDRKKFRRLSLRSLKLLILDWLGIVFAHLIITDTKCHASYWSDWWFVRKSKIRTVYLGVNDKIFHPMPHIANNRILVHFHGTFIPLQGTTKIVEAAKLCASHQNISFRMIGAGRDLGKAKKLATDIGVKNIEFIDRNVPVSDLVRYLGEADIVLGIFGDTAKAQRVIPNKVYEGLAAERAIITMDTPAIRESFSDRDMMLVSGDPRSIADAIITLSTDPVRRKELAKRGHEAVSAYRPVPIARSLLKTIESFKLT
jgi:glycosyltransferase involved in cell wall biosynthesis